MMIISTSEERVIDIPAEIQGRTDVYVVMCAFCRV